MRVLQIVLLLLVMVLLMLLCGEMDSSSLSNQSTTAISMIPQSVVRSKRNTNNANVAYAEISWESLLLLLPPKPRSCGEVRDTTLNRRDFYLVDRPLWLRRQPDEPVGSCPARFRLHVDPDRLWPRAVIRTECLCEGSRCARRGAHVCVTVYIVRTVVARSGRRREPIPVGCLCAVRRATISRPPRPAITM